MASRRLILASASPRRRQILKELKIPFTVQPSQMLEPPPGLLQPAVYARRLALAKARIIASKVTEGLVLGADTIVVHKKDILGKPTDFADACRMLHQLQGTRHKVITAVAVIDAATGKAKVAHAVSTVTMRPLTIQEIARLGKKNMDKAGSYAVQAKKDPVVEKIEGSYTNVVGLPVELLRKLLKS